MKLESINLSAWQKEFVDGFASSDRQRSVLIAAAGTGKTVASLKAVEERLKVRPTGKIIVVSDRLALRDQWSHAANSYGIAIKSELNGGPVLEGISTTYQSLANKEHLSVIEEIASRGSLLMIVDEADRFQKKAVTLCEQLLGMDRRNQCLFVSRQPLLGLEAEDTYKFGHEYLFEPKLIHLPSTQIQIARFAPSIGLLNELRLRTTNLDQMSWREFEVLVSELLESDGYEIELMSGTKDGGVDVVAYKDLGEAGLFKTLWQAKKYKTSRKIGIETMRELADVRNEHNASKAFIVTSSYLTAGALARVQRDEYVLGKVDRDDLQAWIHRKLYE
ncbi:restriction endonuclease [uncultured Desulfuromonas sp.]|uniref:restriction endonuclease n=1 Tax=uncultured Desulfuromonas sp. TaxID=181013 RepID=UPI002AABBD8B|nr:restriction endonuclease [uncultured Desulfuromonas sp.]